MKLNSHLELCLYEGQIKRSPTSDQNGIAQIHGLEFEIFINMSIMGNELIHEGDIVYFFIVPTKYIVDDITGYGQYTAVNISRFRRRTFLNSFTSNRPCTGGTTIPSVPFTHTKTKEKLYYNYTLNEFNQLVITIAPMEILPFTLVTEKENIHLIESPYNQSHKMECRDYHGPIHDRWE